MIPVCKLVEGIEALPPLSETVPRIMALLRDEKSNIADFEAVAQSDPSIATNLLKVANSPFYGSSSPVSRLSAAVARVGFKCVFDVVMATSYRKAIPARIPGYGLSAPDFWLHSTATAVYAESLGRELRLKCSGIGYTAGLLHDVGKLVIGEFLARECAENSWGEFGTAAEERELLGSNHSDIGLEISVRWNLPIEIAHACRWHHEPDKAGDAVYADLVALIHVADFMANQAGFNGGGAVAETLDRSILKRFSMTEEMMERIMEELKDKIIQVSDLTSV